jgi:hypothetical protein
MRALIVLPLTTDAWPPASPGRPAGSRPGAVRDAGAAQ